MEDNSPFQNVTFEEVAETDDPPEEEEEQDQPQDEEIDQEELRKEDEASNEDVEEEEETPEEEEDQPESEEEPEEDQDDTEEEEETVSVIDALKAQTGFETDKDYDNSLDGAAEFINDAADQRAEQKVNETIDQLPEDVQTYMNYRMNGGDPDEFFQTWNSNWSDTEIQEDNPDQHERIVRQRMKEEGYDEDQIESAIDDYKSGGNLYGEAERSLNRLQTLEEQERENLVEDQERKRDEWEEQIEETWNEIETTLEEKNELNGLPIPKGKEDDFLSWMKDPVDEVNGQPVSQRDKVAQNADVETLLTLDYVLYLMNDEDLSFSDIIDRKATSKKAEDLESLLDGETKKTPSDRSTGPSGDGSSSDEVDTDSIPEVTELIN